MTRLALLLALVASPAAAQQCGPRAEVLAYLASEFGESVTVSALGHDSRFMWEFTAAAGGSWTLLRSTPDGISCLMASGGQYETYAVPKSDPA